jgi:transposase
MLRMDLVHVIRHKVLVEGRSQREVAREMKVARKTVRKYLTQAEPRRVEKAPRRRWVKQVVAPAVESLLASWEGRTTAKQRVTAPRVLEELRAQGPGPTASLTVIKEILSEWRRKRREVYVPLTYRIGDLAEVDFFEVTVEIGDVKRKAWKFLMRLMSSGADFAWLYERCDQVSFLDGHVRAFEFFGGVPGRIVYDNLKPAVKRIVGVERELTERFVALASHYLFEPCFARVGEGHDKGGVEARGRGIRLQHMVPIPRGESLEVLSRELLARLVKQASEARAGQESVAEKLEKERARLRALPAEAFDARQKSIVIVSRRSLVRVDRAEYSVPEEWAGLRASVMALISPTTVELQLGKEQVTHVRQKPGGKSVDYRHYLRELSRKPQALRQVAEVLVTQLGEPFQRLWTRLVASHGEREGARLLGDVVAVVKSDGEDAVRAALTSALERDRLDLYTLSLSRRRPPSIVAVPQALSEVTIESGSAKAYDALLGPEWVQ